MRFLKYEKENISSGSVCLCEENISNTKNAESQTLYRLGTVDEDLRKCAY